MGDPQKKYILIMSNRDLAQHKFSLLMANPIGNLHTINTITCHKQTKKIVKVIDKT